MDIPKGYQSKDVIDRRNGEKPTLSDKVRDVAIKVRTDWKDMKQAEKNRKGEQPDFKQIGGQKIPSYKKGGKIKKTGLAFVHKGERVVPKKAARKKG
jgi:hypothetical protein